MLDAEVFRLRQIPLSMHPHVFVDITERRPSRNRHGVDR